MRISESIVIFKKERSPAYRMLVSIKNDELEKQLSNLYVITELGNDHQWMLKLLREIL